MSGVELVLAAGRVPAPVTTGIPWPRGALRDPSNLALVNPEGAAPLQTRVLDRWSDGSVRWLLLDWFAGEEERWRLVEGGPAHGPSPLSVRAAGDRISIGTGTARFELTPTSPWPGGGRLRLVDAGGAVRGAEIASLAVEEEGPVRVAVAASGRVGRLDLSMRLHFHAGSSVVRFEVALTNPERARHPGGIWDLGDPGSVLFEEVRFEFPLPGPQAPVVWASAAPSEPLEEFPAPFRLHQESSGGENWTSAVHVNRQGRVPLAFRGWRLQAGPIERCGLRATPTVRFSRGDRSVALATSRFWQEFPKAVSASDAGLALSLWPAESADLHELQGGERKTHVFHVAFADEPLEWVRDPAVVRAEPAWYAASGAVPYLVPRDADPRPRFHELADAAIEGPDSFEAKREAADEFGWRHCGDLPADHEGVAVSHYNNQYDAAYGFACRFLATGDARWWRLMDDLARHVADVDVYHTDRDKSAYDHGLFWHTAHHVDAGRATHRSFPGGRGLAGGGPANEHCYTGGLVLHHYLTGDEGSRRTSIEIARWVVDMDDGAKSLFGPLSRRPTGLASMTASPLYHGPGRGAANSIHALLDAHRLTGVPTYLVKAEELLRRTIHPADDVPARNLLDAERRWSYVVHLQMLGRWLDERLEAGDLGKRYAYARASLLAYARWMLEHEYPYLDRPEILEFPTETWAAQDLRKAEVLAHAARHARGEERVRFIDRAAWFQEGALERLASMPTHVFTRPVVLVLTQGFRRIGGTAPPPEGEHDFGRPPPPFVPQKEAIRRRLRRVAATAAVLLVASLLAFVAAIAG